MKMSKYSTSSNTWVEKQIHVALELFDWFHGRANNYGMVFSNTNVAKGQYFRTLLGKNMSLSNNIYFDHYYVSAFYVFEELQSDLENLENKIFFHFPSKKLNLNSILFFHFFHFLTGNNLIAVIIGIDNHRTSHTNERVSLLPRDSKSNIVFAD